MNYINKRTLKVTLFAISPYIATFVSAIIANALGCNGIQFFVVYMLGAVSGITVYMLRENVEDFTEE